MTSAPHLAYLRLWLLSILIAALLLSGEDAFWRNRGYRPFVDDTPSLWTYHCGSLDPDDHRTIVFLGTSRMRGAIDTTLLRQNSPYSVVQLAVDGSKSPIGAMAYLVDHVGFSGVIVCEVLAPLMDESRWADQSGYYDHAAAWPESIDEISRSVVRSLLVSRNRRLALRSVVARLVNGVELPAPSYVASRFDRSVQFDFSLVPDLSSVRTIRTEALRAEYADADFPTVASLNSELKTIDGLIRRLQQRGGEAVMLRLPSTGERLEIEERYHPRQEYWSSFREHCGGEWIHFSDVPALREIDCPDESHVDQRDAKRLTAGLLEELRRRHVLAEADSSNGSSAGAHSTRGERN